MEVCVLGYRRKPSDTAALASRRATVEGTLLSPIRRKNSQVQLGDKSVPLTVPGPLNGRPKQCRRCAWMRQLQAVRVHSCRLASVMATSGVGSMSSEADGTQTARRPEALWTSTCCAIRIVTRFVPERSLGHSKYFREVETVGTPSECPKSCRCETALDASNVAEGACC